MHRSPDSAHGLARNLESATYVGRILMCDVSCHHLAFQTPEVNWEIWIEGSAFARFRILKKAAIYDLRG